MLASFFEKDSLCKYFRKILYIWLQFIEIIVWTELLYPAETINYVEVTAYTEIASTRNTGTTLRENAFSDIPYSSAKTTFTSENFNCTLGKTGSRVTFSDDTKMNMNRLFDCLIYKVWYGSSWYWWWYWCCIQIPNPRSILFGRRFPQYVHFYRRIITASLRIPWKIPGLSSEISLLQQDSGIRYTIPGILVRVCT